jgi:hypothetical protein
VSVGGRSMSLGSYESNVLYVLRFMVDTDMGGGQWLEVPAGAVCLKDSYVQRPAAGVVCGLRPVQRQRHICKG